MLRHTRLPGIYLTSGQCLEPASSRVEPTETAKLRRQELYREDTRKIQRAAWAALEQSLASLWLSKALTAIPMLGSGHF